MPQTQTDLQLRSEEVQEILTAIPNWMIRWGNTLVFLLILMLLGITWFVKYPDIINSEAIITTQLPPQKEYAKITGKIDTLLVTDYQKVASNTPLAVIENTAKLEDVFFLKAVLEKIKLNNHHFEFPMKDIPFLFLGDIDADFALFENSYEQYMLNKELQPFSNEALANRNTLAEMNSRLKSLNLQQSLNASELNLKKIELARSKKLFEEGVIAAQEYENKQLQDLQATRSYENMNIAISQLKDAISTASLSTKNISINQTREEKKLLRNVIQAFIKLKKAIKDWELRYVLKSNIDGQVAFLDSWTKNQRINAGDLIFTIIPYKNTAYIAKLKTPVLNSGKIKIGQTVNIKLKNYPDTEFGVLKGKIKNISLVVDEKGFYMVDVSLSSKLITSYDKQLEFRQEMQGVAEIITEDLRLIDRFFYQLKEIFKP